MITDFKVNTHLNSRIVEEYLAQNGTTRKVAIVTGASSGIGKELVLYLVKANFHVIMGNVPLFS
jgi:short chain dehydrogenase